MSKSPETPLLDTTLDRLVHRPAARLLASFLAPLPVSPNQVTLFSLAPAFLSAWFFAQGRAVESLQGLFFFYLWAVLDHTDGELARRTGRTSRFGQRLDDACDGVASAAILVGIFIGLLPFWNRHDRHLFEWIFAAGLLPNVLFGLLAAAGKRRARAEGENRRTTDGWTGRDPFYFLMASVIAAFFFGGEFWYSTAMVILLGGVYAVSAVSAYAWRQGLRASESTVIE